MKTMAAAMGADVSDSDSSKYSSDGSQSYTINSASDLSALPINLGYETIE